MAKIFEENYINAIAESNGTLVSKVDAQALDMNIEENKGVTYREYDSSTNNFSVMSWDDISQDWAVTETISSTGVAASESYVANDMSEIDATNVVAGSELTTADGSQYVAINGDWVSVGGLSVSSTSNTDNEVEYNRLLQEEESVNPSVLSKAEAIFIAMHGRATKDFRFMENFSIGAFFGSLFFVLGSTDYKAAFALLAFMSYISMIIFRDLNQRDIDNKK